MKPRLLMLLAVMGGLLVLRWWSPPARQPSVELAAAVVRPAIGSPADSAASVASEDLFEDLSAGSREIEPDELRNAFAVRQPLQLPVPSLSAPVKVAVASPFVGPPAPVSPPPVPPPPPPPIQVIGSWRDEQGVSLFVSGPRGVQQARVGDVIAEYRFIQLAPTQILLKHLPSNREVPLPVPAGAGAPLLTAR